MQRSANFLKINLSHYLYNGFCFSGEPARFSGRAGMPSLTHPFCPAHVPGRPAQRAGASLAVTHPPQPLSPGGRRGRAREGWLRAGQEENRERGHKQVIRLLRDRFFWGLGWLWALLGVGVLTGAQPQNRHNNLESKPVAHK